MGRVDGKVALISGAARGQGRHHAIRLAEEGADVILLDICADIPGVGYPMATPEDLDETVRLVEKFDRRAVAAVVDVRDRPSLQKAVAVGRRHASAGSTSWWRMPASARSGPTTRCRPSPTRSTSI